jgi:glycosyltransferase involved in cell wall biosynthesis
VASVPAHGELKLRALQVFEPPDGGVAEHVVQLTTGLLEHGCEVEVAGPAEARVRTALPEGVEYHALPFMRSYRTPHRDLAALAALFRILRTRRIDLLHAHSAKAGVIGRLVAQAAGVPCVYTPHCFAFIGEVSARRQVFASGVERVLGALTARTICVSRDEREQALRRRVGVPHRLEVIHNGVGPCPRPEADPELRRFAGDRPLVGAVAVHRRQKGLDRLLDAAPEVLARRPDVRFAIVGDGPLLSSHRRRAEELELGSSIIFQPFVPPSARYLRALDLFVLPSRWEAFPIAVLEAMACGIPQVATDVGGTPEAVEHGETGLLVPPGDPAALARAAAELVHDPERRARMAEAGRQRHASLFTVERMVAQTAGVYEEALSGGRSG